MSVTFLTDKDLEPLEDRVKELEESGGAGSGGGGADGVSCTHEWDGTVLTVTSASGTSSADLKGEKGDTGDTGPAGKDGSDYVLTEADKAELVRLVIESLGGNPVFGYVDANNNIIVSGNLADGTYTVKYEMEDGGTMDIGQLVLAEDEPDEPVQTYTNQIPLAIDASDNPFNGGQGWKTGYRLSASGGSETAADGYECTGFIPAKIGDVLRVKNIDLTAENATNIVFYDGSKTPIICNGTNKGTTLALFFSTSEGDGVSSGTIGSSANLTFSTDVAFIRIGSQSITADSILTINEPIV